MLLQNSLNTLFSLFLSLALSVNLYAETYTESGELHGLFTEVLQTHVKNGHVDYSGIKNDLRFTEYLKTIELGEPDTLVTEAEKLAFWINAYNALAIKGILDGLSPGTFWSRISYFKSTKYELGSITISLYDLEHKIIIPFKDPRIHFAIVCASLSCPKLRSEAYLATRLNEQLDDNAIDFINDQQKNEIDLNNKPLRLSKIFLWFKTDFEKHSGSVQKYISNFVTDDARKQHLLEKNHRINFLKYDWNLNGTLAD